LKTLRSWSVSIAKVMDNYGMAFAIAVAPAESLPNPLMA
jgi:hypothetical protein